MFTRLLEWNRVLDETEPLALTAPGRARVRSWEDPKTWAQSHEEAALRQEETTEVLALLAKDALWGPLRALNDPEPVLETLRQGGVLEVAGLVEIRAWTTAIDCWIEAPKELITGKLMKASQKALQSSKLNPMEILRVLGKVLTPNGEISENASRKFATLRAETESLKHQIQKVLEGLVRKYSGEGLLQGAYSDFRDGRYVLPVKISSQGRIDGVVTGGSASGQTAYLEPREIEALNRELVQKQNALLEEIYRILKETTEFLRPFTADLEHGIGVLVHWDAVQARARVGLKYGGRGIELSPENNRLLLLTETVHPLLWKSMPEERIVRNTVRLEAGERVMMITGPNTGGKTVLLKTLGLAGIAARTGFPFPGGGTVQVPYFDSFFVDLGDSQSIERSLSSFSGHVVQLKEILDHNTSRSLVLLDEMTTATDPEEGAALARAFIETLLGEGAQAPILVTTTHDPTLKTFGLGDDRVLMVSMEFDEATLSPTYRLVEGVPGRSRALEIAEKFGIPRRVLDLARSFLSKEHDEFERKTGALEKIYSEANKERTQAVLLRQEAERLKAELGERMEKTFGDVLERTRARIRKLTEDVQDRVRETLKTISETRSRRAVDVAREEADVLLEHAERELDAALKIEAPEVAKKLAEKAGESLPPLPEAIDLGVRVRIPKLKSVGTVVELKGRQARVRLETLQGKVGSGMTLRVDAADLVPLPLSEQRTEEKTRVELETEGTSGPVAREIDLRGQRLEDAMRELSVFLDRAARSAVPEVTVIHGLGTGAIREGARALLKKLPYVKTFMDGGPGRGGAGATVVIFDRG
jgi:DNA mismatch repair protein MutS2